ncbi:MAG: helix-turn-helix domain-containing protein [Kouleothrix sp.]|jgi:transcriptional regulator with XRE-family HTH domain|nr:helix-turn-helix domain-containing protein [Kouleothrix sp.]
MSINRSKSYQSRPKKARDWGALIRTMREKRQWKRRELIARYQQRLEERNPNYDLSEIPSETWLGRVETGQSATVTRQNIVLLCEALECTQKEQVDVLLAADRNIFANPDGEMSKMDEFLARAYKQLSHNSGARRTVSSKLQDYNSKDDIEGEDTLQLLLAAVQAALDELKKNQPNRKHPSKDQALALGGAD